MLHKGLLFVETVIWEENQKVYSSDLQLSHKFNLDRFSRDFLKIKKFYTPHHTHGVASIYFSGFIWQPVGFKILYRFRFLDCLLIWCQSMHFLFISNSALFETFPPSKDGGYIYFVKTFATLQGSTRYPKRYRTVRLSVCAISVVASTK